MRIEVLADAEAVAARAANMIAEYAREAVEKRGRFVIALSGGRTPWVMLRKLAGEDVPWSGMHVLQVDERIAPAGDPDRNLTHLEEALLRTAPIDRTHLYAMPVESPDPSAGAAEYAKTIEKLAGSPPVVDLVHLGLGSDGHTASLIPSDPVLQIVDRDVAITGLYQGRKRMTLTYPTINRARRVLWVITGNDKVKALDQLLHADPAIPAGRIRQDEALVLADRAAAPNR